jgi:tRNA threonylcarbamoyladenosine biosynthesis protein TsaB
MLNVLFMRLMLNDVVQTFRTFGAMSYILCMETATGVCSVAVVSETAVISVCEDHEGNAHASKLTLLVQEAVSKAGITLQELDAVAVSKGPGSYTGLRVGVSAAKGLCYVLGKPLIAVNTLASLANMFRQTMQADTAEAVRLVPMIDARRMEVYCAMYDTGMNEIQPAQAKIIDGDSFAQELAAGKVYFFGNGASKCSTTIMHPNAVFVDHIVCSAAGMHGPAVQAFTGKRFEDVAYFEPFYLKDFVGTTPKPKV